MAQPARRSAKPKAARGAGQMGPQRQAGARRPFLRFYHPAPLRTKTLALLDELERSRDPTAHREALARVVVELTQCGLDAYFMQPLKVAKAGFIVEQSAGLGFAGAVNILSAVIHSVVGRMGRAQLLSVCGSLRGLMR